MLTRLIINGFSTQRKFKCQTHLKYDRERDLERDRERDLERDRDLDLDFDLDLDLEGDLDLDLIARILFICSSWNSFSSFSKSSREVVFFFLETNKTDLQSYTLQCVGDNIQEN